MRALVIIGLLLGVSLFILECKGEDSWPITASDKAFFEEVRKAVLADDIEWISTALNYPIVLKSSKGEVRLENKKDVKENAALILSAHLKTAIRNQSSNTLFKNWQGVMIGKGELWFSQVADRNQKEQVWVYRIIGINLLEAQLGNSRNP